MKTLLIMLFALSLALGNPWIARKYVAADKLKKADVIVPLRGAPEEERARLAKAAELVRQGYARTLLVSVSAKPLYGRSARSLIETYLEKQGFPTKQLKFCEHAADSTMEEARALLACFRQSGVKEALIVTSEYHSRRARFLFHHTLKGSGIVTRVHPVYNREYWDPYWWRQRRWAKTFLIESLAWAENSFEHLYLWARQAAASWKQEVSAALAEGASFIASRREPS